MKLSVIINSHNEGGRLKATVCDFLAAGADEVVVCADGTTDGSCDNLPSKTVLIRTDNVGCGRAKFIATAQSSGDVLMWVDGHQNVMGGSIRDMAQKALDEKAIVNPGTVNICYNSDWMPERTPGGKPALFPNDSSLLPLCKSQYRSTHDNGRCTAVGVGLCMSRETYVRVGGWNRFAARHGSQERGMGLRAFMAGVPVLVDESVLVGHEFFGKEHPSRNPSVKPLIGFRTGLPPWVNVWHSFMAVTSESFFKGNVQPWLESHERGRNGMHALTNPLALSDRDHFSRNCKVRSDRDLLELMNRLVAKVYPPKNSGGASLEPMAVGFIRALAKGRCLECGTGSTKGTQAMLAGAMHVVSIDHIEKYTQAAMELVKDPRVEFVHCPQQPDNGFYDLSKLTGRFDFMLIDGPPGTQARATGIQQLLPFLSAKGVMLVDDAKRDLPGIEAAVAVEGLCLEMLPTRRGLAKITRDRFS